MVLSNRQIDPTLLKRTENARNYTANSWQGPRRNIEPFLEASKWDKEQNNSSKEWEEYDHAVDPRTGWRFYKPAQGNLLPSSPSSSSTNWESNHWTTRSWNFWPSSRSDHFFSDRTSFGWPGDKLPDNRRGVVRQNTHSHDTFVHAQLIKERSARVQSLTHATRVAQVVCLGVSKSSLSSQRYVSHVAALATEHLHTISLTNITCLPTIFSLTDLSYLGPFWIGVWNPARPTAEWRIHEVCISHRLWAQDEHNLTISNLRKNWVGQKSWDRSATSKNWVGQKFLGKSCSLSRIQLDRKIDVDMIRYVQYQKMGDDYRKMLASPLYAYGDEEKIDVVPFVQWRTHTDDSAREHCWLGSWRWRITKKNWPHRCMHVEEERASAHSYSSWSLQKRESLKSNSSQEPRASGKPDALFSSRSGRTGKSVRKFYVQI